MSLYGQTKGTELEKEIDQYAEAESRGVGMYYALALLAEEKGLADLARELRQLGDEEAKHAGLYMVLNGRVPEDIFAVMKQAAAGETSAFDTITEFANRVNGLGLEQAATEIESAAKDEAHHGKVLNELLQQYAK